MKVDMGKKGIKQGLGNKKILTDKAALDLKSKSGVLTQLGKVPYFPCWCHLTQW